MRARFDTLFGRLFGVLFVAIVLAHLLAFAWFHHLRPASASAAAGVLPRRRRPTRCRRTRATRHGHRARGSAARWCH